MQNTTIYIFLRITLTSVNKVMMYPHVTHGVVPHGQNMFSERGGGDNLMSMDILCAYPHIYSEAQAVSEISRAGQSIGSR